MMDIGKTPNISKIKNDVKKNYRWIIRYVLFSAIIAVVSEFFLLTNWQDLIGALKAENVMKEYDIDEVSSLQNCELKGEKIVVQSDDPQLIIDNVDTYVSLLEIRISEISAATLPIQVYWSTDDKPFMSDCMVSGDAQENYKTFTLKLNQNVKSLRVDIGILPGETYKIDKIILNPNFSWYTFGIIGNMSGIRMFFYFLIIMGTLLAIRDFDKFKKNVFQYRWAIGAIFVLLCTIFKLHGSSMGEISKMITGVDTSRVWGTSRGIRSDEYVVFSEMALSQTKSGFRWFSDIWGYSPSDMFMIYGQPVKNLMTIYRPFSMGYIFLGAEHGLAFYWSSRLVCCILVSFEFGRILTKDNRHLSLAYAILVALSPVVQWWYSTNEFVEMLIFGQLAIILIYWYINTNSIKWKILQMFGLVICAGGYIMTLYPAWMIPFAYVFAGCLIAILIENKKKVKIHKSDILIWVCGLGVVGVSMIYIFKTSSDTIMAILNTAYPGKRTYFGGPIDNLVKIFRGWSSPLWSFISIQNPCEAVGFVSFMPIGIVMSGIVLFKDKKKDSWLIALNILNILLVIFFVFGAGGFIAKITLLEKTTPRMINAIEFLNLLIAFRAMILYDFKETAMKMLLPLGIVISTMSFYENADTLTPALKMIILLLVITSVIILLNIDKEKYQRYLLVFSLIVGLIGGGLVNPIESGLTTIYRTPVVQAIQTINNQDEGLWVVGCNSVLYNNIPTIVGAHTLNAVATYPDTNLWNKLGLQADEDIWNRYAHMSVELSDRTYLELRQADAIALHVTVEDLKKLGVKYVLCNSDMSGFDGLKQRYSYKSFTIQEIQE